MDNKEKILFVVNPVAGGGNEDDTMNNIKLCIEEYTTEYDFQYYETTGENDEKEIKRLISNDRPDKVGVAGGDGTLRMVATILLGADIPFAIIPAGSANGMATELGLPDTIKESIDILLNGEAKAADCIRINEDEICLHLSDIGMNAQLIKYYEKNGWRGKLGYLRGAIKVFFRRKEMSVTINKDGKEICRTAYMVALANARMFGTKVVINPDGNVFDGLFEVVIIKKISVPQVIRMFFGTDANKLDVFEIICTTNATITTDTSVHFQVDGEYIDKTQSLTATIVKKKLKVMLPPEKV